MIITRTPFRISFFGGGTDYPDWYLNHGGSVLATTIDKYCYISCRYLPPFFEHKHRVVYSRIEEVQKFAEINHPAVRETMAYFQCTKGLEIHHDGDLPARSGLGSSSSFTVGLVNALSALQGLYVSKEDLACKAIHIEQNLIRESVGSQDQVSASFGGFNRIDFSKNNTFSVNPVVISSDRLTAFKGHLLLFFTGFSRIASEIAKHKINNLANKSANLIRMRDMVDDATEILHGNNDLTDFGMLLNEGWLLKRQLSDKVSTPEIDHIYDTAMKAGAIGGKILGAGGGGFLLLFVKPEHQPNVIAKLQNLIHVPFDFDYSGSKVVFYQPNGM
jgi:D-glycero-alpha-D-manno-heptose-7-phosphate kinase